LVFIQLPVFIGLYRSLQFDIELRQAPLIPGLAWCANLAAPDMLLDWSGWMFDVVQHGIGGFLVLGPYFNILPIFTVVLFIVQQKMFTPPPTNEQAEMQQKIMGYMMVLIGLMFYTVASGLCLYFIASSLWGLTERTFLPKAAKTTPGAAATPSTTSKAAQNGSPAKRAAKRKQRGGK
jgi:YidC/Oxa1 family membrane protein insertase